MCGASCNTWHIVFCLIFYVCFHISMFLCKDEMYGNYYSDVIMGAKASQITSLTIGYSTVYSGADQRKHQSSASLTFVRGNYRWPVNSPHKRPVTRKVFPFDDVIIDNSDIWQSLSLHDWRWKSVVTLRWMGATFSGSGLAPTEYRQRHTVCTGFHAVNDNAIWMREIYINSDPVTTWYLVFNITF